MSEPPVVFLTVPNYGSICPATMAAVLTASARVCPMVTTEYASLLAHNFNRSWCECLNLRRERPVDYFCMLHADVAPDPFWLDVLMDEMRRVDADVISAVIAIKDGRGLTSTGWQHSETLDMRRLTLKQVMRLPRTFGRGEAPKGHHLLVNTGCWLARLDRPWVEEFPGFSIKDWVSRDEDGEFLPGVFSEDWNWSRWLAARGDVRVFATRAVRLSHVGTVNYRNDSAWGEWGEDVGDFLDPAERVRGWMTREELRWLREKAAAAKVVVEVGSWHGRSTLALAQSCPGIVYAVDHFQGSPGDSNSELLDANAEAGSPREEFKKNLAPHLKSGKVKLLECASREAAQALFADGLRPDLVFLDGDHRLEAVVADIRDWKPLLSEGGVLAGHDRNLAGVRLALDRVLPDQWRVAPGTLWEWGA